MLRPSLSPSTLAASIAVALVTTVLVASPVSAALKRYETNRQLLQHYETASPEAEFTAQPGDAGVILIDQTGPSPVLTRWVTANLGNSVTILVPSLSGFIFVRGKSTESPGIPSTGTGSTASSIDWGNIAGWTISGGTYCRSVPSYACGLANFANEETVPSNLNSTNFDVGTFVFHGTGFSTAGRIIFTSSTGFGNAQYYLRGAELPNGTVPTLPLLGIGTIGLSVIALGIASARRSK